MNQRHLSDDRLIELSAVAGPADMRPTDLQLAAAGDVHLRECPGCQSRYTALASLLGEITTAADAEADAAFSDERLARQHARILQRVDQDGRPGRLIAFPAAQTPAPLLQRARPFSRWVAAAAVAGLLVGLLAGQFLPDGRQGGQRTPPAQIVANTGNSAIALRAVSTTMSEDEFLGQVELSAVGRPALLRPLDDMTPRAWEIR
jgi:hypothetical protein